MVLCASVQSPFRAVACTTQPPAGASSRRATITVPSGAYQAANWYRASLVTEAARNTAALTEVAAYPSPSLNSCTRGPQAVSSGSSAATKNSILRIPQR